MAELIYRDDDHSYWHNAIRIPGATELLKYWGYIDDTYYTEEGREIGTAVHAGTSAYDKGDDSYQLFESPAILKRIEAYMLFRQEKQFTPELVESMQHNDVYNIACRLDRVGPFAQSNLTNVVELKCGAPAKWHSLQTAIQSLCLGRPGYIRRYAVYLQANGLYKIKEHTDLNEIAIVRGLVVTYWYNVNAGIKLKGNDR